MAGKIAPDVRVKINGAPLPQQAENDLLSVRVETDVDAPGMFTLRLLSWDMHRNRVTWADDELFDVGHDVAVEMGYVDHLEPVLDGEITALEPEFGSRDVPLLTVRGHDRRHRLMRGARTRAFTGVRDSDIVTRIAREQGLAVRATDTGVTHEHVLQHDETDWAFLTARARRIGYELAMDAKTLEYRPRPYGDGPSVELKGADLLSFSPRLNAFGQVGEVKVRGWNLKDAEDFEGTASGSDVGSRMDGKTAGPAAGDRAFGEACLPRVDLGVADREAAGQAARGLLRERALSYLTGEGECLGRPAIRAGRVLAVREVGERFSGPYYVVSARHDYSGERGYTTSFSVRRNAV